jgi:dipeptidyl-peptidase-3
VKANGKLTEEVYKIDGRYAKQITEVVRHLNDAIPFATEPMQNALRALIQWYRTGEQSDREKYDIAWVADKASPWTPSTASSRCISIRAASRAAGSARLLDQPEKTRPSRRLATTRSGSRTTCRTTRKYRKPNVTGIIANAIDVIVETGDSGPVTPIGINLPNDERHPPQYGSKSVSLTNILEAYDKSTPGTMRGEFSWTPEEAARRRIRDDRRRICTTDMHEVIGQASGQQAAGFKGHARSSAEGTLLRARGRAARISSGSTSSPTRSCRSSESFPPPIRKHRRAEYEGYTRNALVQLRRVREGRRSRKTTCANRQMIVRWLMGQHEGDRAADARRQDLSRRWSMRRRSAKASAGCSPTCSASSRKAITPRGEAVRHLRRALRSEGAGRSRGARGQAESAVVHGFRQPKLEPVTDASGKITDVKISYPMDLTTQMLEYDGVKR